MTSSKLQGAVEAVRDFITKRRSEENDHLLDLPGINQDATQSVKA